MPSPFEAVSTYFYAKDGNRPFLMRRAFAEDVHLEMVVKTDAISFPSSAKGVAAIEEILGRRFANEFENVYTFCLVRPTEANRHHFPCHWLVGMSAKNNGPIRVGSGRYDWYFTSDAQCLVEKLIITIDVMQIFPANELDRIMSWIASLPYPWCGPDEAARDIPRIEGLAPVERYLKEVRPIPPERCRAHTSAQCVLWRSRKQSRTSPPSQTRRSVACGIDPDHPQQGPEIEQRLRCRLPEDATFGGSNPEERQRVIPNRRAKSSNTTRANA